VKFRPVGRAKLFHADGRTDGRKDGRDEANGRFSQFRERALKKPRPQTDVQILQNNETSTVGLQ
jgi:hypothetical protein